MRVSAAGPPVLPAPSTCPPSPTAQVEVKTTPDTPDSGNLQRAADFIHAFILGFDIKVGTPSHRETLSICWVDAWAAHVGAAAVQVLPCVPLRLPLSHPVCSALHWLS